MKVPAACFKEEMIPADLAEIIENFVHKMAVRQPGQKESGLLSF